MYAACAALNYNDETIRSNAYEVIAPEMEALDPRVLQTINLDVGPAVQTVLGALPEIRALRADVRMHLPTFRLSLLDQLEQYAFALSWAHSLFITATTAKDDLAAVAEEGTACRERLYADAMYLCRYKLLNPEAFKAYKGTTGYNNVVNDLLLLTSVLLRNWASIEGKCPHQQSDVTRGDKLAMRILRLIGLREQAPVVIAATADSRKRAFTLFAQAYDAVRKAVTYLRWDTGDADSIAPSLYAKSKRKASKDDPAPTEQPELPAPPTATIDTSPDAARTAPAASPPAVSSRPKQLSVPVPGSNPFMDRGDQPGTS